MLVARATLCAFVIVLSAAPAAVLAAQAKVPANIAALIKTEDKLNDKCRGGSGDDPATMKACDQREKYVKKLEKLGWCWGHAGQIDADRTWEKCKH
jgi:hypothetical protein